MNSTERDEVRTLEILEAIQERSDLTQRHLASRLGVAVMDPAGKGASFLGVPVFERLADCRPFAACLLTSLQDFEGVYRKLVSALLDEPRSRAF